MKEGEHQMAIPDLFRCPISLDLLKDPVTLCTGQTYDRSSIEKWLAAGNLTCPVTMLKLHDLTIVPNHTLRHLIHQWLQFGHHLDPDYLETIQPLASLKHNLESHDSSFETKLEALKKLRASLSEQSSPWMSSCLVQLSFLPLLLHTVFGEPRVSNNQIKIAEQGLFCMRRLLSLCEGEEEGQLRSLNSLREEAKFKTLVVLFEQGTPEVKTNLCLLIEAVSSSPETKHLCCLLGNSKLVVQEMGRMVGGEEEDEEVAEAGVRGMEALCRVEENREGMVVGAMEALIENVRRERRSAAAAMAAVEKLVGSSENAKKALMENPDGIRAVVKMVFRVCDEDHRGSESAVETLVKVCGGCVKAREQAIGAGVLTQLLFLLQSQCCSSTKAKARLLLQLLRNKFIFGTSSYSLTTHPTLPN